MSRQILKLAFEELTRIRPYQGKLAWGGRGLLVDVIREQNRRGVELYEFGKEPSANRLRVSAIEIRA